MMKLRKYLRDHSFLLLLMPYLVFFVLFIIIPIIAAIVLSFTQFDSIQAPVFVGIDNYVRIFTQDAVFMQKVLPNTLIFSIIVGPGGYILSVLMAWLLAQLTKVPRTICTIIAYSPSLTSGVIMSTVWQVLFSGDQAGYLNSLLIQWGIIMQPITFLQNESLLMPIMIGVSLWSSMGIGFLAILAGFVNMDQELLEAAKLDGVSNRFQELIYVIIPYTKPTMLFGAVMAMVNTFAGSGIGVSLSGTNPTPGYAGQLIVNHIEDVGYLRYEIGYAGAVSVVLLLFIWWCSKVCYKLFGSSDE